MTQISAEPMTHYVIARFSTRMWLYVLDTVLLVPLNLVLLLATWFLPTPLAMIIGLLALPVWFALWWRGLSATPAKLLCRLSIQPATGPGSLTWSLILRRLGVQEASSS